MSSESKNIDASISSPQVDLKDIRDAERWYQAALTSAEEKVSTIQRHIRQNNSRKVDQFVFERIKSKSV